MTATEVNFDALVGPTHNFAGLALGNLASQSHKGACAYPKQAALQSLEKMKLLMDLGLRQAVLPPHERPHLATLRRIGFTGPDNQLPEKAYKEDPNLLLAVSSASPMWAANIASVTAAIDTQDEHVHLTPANLSANFHRSIEAEATTRILKAIFADPLYFTVHDPLPSGALFSDEGAANHTRFCRAYGEPGVHLFVYGTGINQRETKFPARQTLAASQAIARLHKVLPNRLLFAKQSAEAIDAGVFHNDVIAVSNQNLFFCHENAFTNQIEVLNNLRNAFANECEGTLQVIEVKEEEVSLRQAVSTYLFNSQIITLPDEAMAIISPTECQEQIVVSRYLDHLIANSDNPIREVHYVNLKESMKNGGGPACTRFRLPLSDLQISAIKANVFLTDTLYTRLKRWIETHFREEIRSNDLHDPKLVDETQRALDELTTILSLGKVYDFQR
ncbi:MAG: N-succinylarginine dihydrolase [Waddliaceae bacterium]